MDIISGNAISIFGLILGAVCLYYGADWIVRGGSNLAHKMGISRLAIGLTIVAFGTSLPELIVSVLAALKDSPSIAIGNVVGSNVANVGLVLGVVALIFPISYRYITIKRDILIYLASCALFIGFIWDGTITRIEGAILFSGLVGYIWLNIKSPHPIVSEVDQDKLDAVLKSFVTLFIGMAVLSIGAKVFVDSAVTLAHAIGISEVAIGMSIVALGTSLPELATSIVAALKKEHAISIGNIVGSNLFNILSVIGISAIIKPLTSSTSILSFEIPIMVAFGLVLIPLGIISQPISKFNSFLLLSGYVGFIYFLF
ncbi:MAG: calcium/sodium antiporter [Candidatus Marinimicrobia bacterium]|jgi:cation:H+ antiporter|nr:calcium/sodium antiporter [Candidatus Neomarinimicrobiota bacterium]MBT3618120.1 calcium/sodium antiporter [Candidatus Neomarinimicrobiota bacterium]MBT3828591.1 calcium/sodium antiporter [Candidatus Neomarinimicrobiota bacterium]MBT3996947.1 calcium/sodium antiporter [Candidatus Neomarinimicrobiota bacterium]MBT4280911.1 calcium/sodium antiporter [Candidatus Neomarinimicrobiota bacterium]